ncbi:MAG: ABC transporter ATP-binding protein, partial [Gammaproteobacteria bacterium]|nr:ABC transporter ATP-binding protein [Gammaproteobacteria bacterium]
MSSNTVLMVNKLSKHFKCYAKPADRLWEALGLLRHPIPAFHALSEVSFTLNKGEVLGVIGRNGAGKSTLLQLICGTLQPTSGSVTTTGRIAALLELGSGFNPEFSGRDNVYLNAAVLGLSQAEIEAKFDEIVAFSELAAFIDQPVKTYSSGMFVRLAFAVATSIEPDILIIDEALSVGDGAFSRKSFDRIMALKARGTTILFCSHALYQIEALCDRAIWLKDGKVALLGDTQEVTSSYQAFLSQLDQGKTQIINDSEPQILDSTSTIPRLISVNIGGTGQREVTEQPMRFVSGMDSIFIDIELSTPITQTPPTVAIVITNESGVQVCS